MIHKQIIHFDWFIIYLEWLIINFWQIKTMRKFESLTWVVQMNQVTELSHKEHHYSRLLPNFFIGNWWFVEESFILSDSSVILSDSEHFWQCSKFDSQFKGIKSLKVKRLNIITTSEFHLSDKFYAEKFASVCE